MCSTFIIKSYCRQTEEDRLIGSQGNGNIKGKYEARIFPATVQLHQGHVVVQAQVEGREFAESDFGSVDVAEVDEKGVGRVVVTF